jgi:hypothetical protein
MNSFFYGIAHIFESLFKILPFIGPLVNILIVAVGTIGAGIWIWYGIKNKADKGNYHPES